MKQLKDKEGEEQRGRYSGFGGIAEAGGTIPWLIIKIVQWVARRLRLRI